MSSDGNEKTMCNTYYFGALFQTATMLVTLLPMVLYACICKTKGNMTTISKNWYMLSYFGAILNFGILIFRVVSNQSLFSLYSLANVDVPSSGWFVDYVILWLISVIAHYRIRDYYVLSNVDESGKTFKLTKGLSYLDLLGGPALILAKLTLLTATEKHKKVTVESRVLYTVIYFVCCYKELRLWVPLVKQWDISHCFLDGFMGTNNEANLYVTISIIIVNTISCWVFWEINIKKNPLLAIVMIIIAFYNATIAIAVYLIWAEISGYVSNICLKKTWSEETTKKTLYPFIVILWLIIALYGAYMSISKYFL